MLTVIRGHTMEILTLNELKLQNKKTSDQRFKRLKQKISSHLRHVWIGLNLLKRKKKYQKMIEGF